MTKTAVGVWGKVLKQLEWEWFRTEPTKDKFAQAENFGLVCA